MTLGEIQSVSLDILKEIDSFCQENDIHYSLGYGSLIGAVRHRGVIPWDDDIDIIMPRPDYMKFVSAYKSKIGDFSVIAPELGNGFFFISRICEMKRTDVLKYYKWTDLQTGVFIDIFPIDAYTPENKTRMNDLYSSSYEACRARRPFSWNILDNLRIVLARLRYRRRDRDIYIQEYLKEIKSLDFDSATQVCNYGSPYRDRDIHRKGVFEKYIRVPFEDISVSIIADYDEYLRSIYGDYMQLPPPERQRRWHTANKFYWKSDSK